MHEESGVTVALTHPAGQEIERALCVAVMGTGSAGMRHLDVLKRLQGVRMLAVPIRPDRLPQLKEQGFDTAAGLEEAVRLQASRCIIATDTGRHAEDSLAALERGLNLLVEKPLATDASSARRVIRQARALGREVFVGCVLRFSDSLNTVRELCSHVGPLHAVRIECRSYLPQWRPGRSYQQSYAARPREGGVLLDLIHEIDYAGWLFGWPKAIQARLKNTGRLGITEEEVAELIWETASGAVVSMSLDYLTRPPQRSLTLYGALGTLEWDGITGTICLALAGATLKSISSAQTRDDMFLLQARAFVDAAHQRDARLATAEDGLRALAVCDAARIASRSHRTEPVAYE